jgi:hypothetical protein
MDKKEGGKSLGQEGENRPSTFADIIYVNRSYLRLLIREKSRSRPLLKGKTENKWVDSQAGQRRFTAPF